MYKNLLKSLLVIILSFASTCSLAQASQPYRVLHVPIDGLSYQELTSVVDKASDAGFNTLIFQILNSVRFEKSIYVAKPSALTVDEFKKLVSYARGKHFEVVPEITLLAKQNLFPMSPKFLGYMYNKSTYSPEAPRIYEEMVFPLLDEVVHAIHPSAIHIGHDELDTKDIPPLPADLFLRDVIKINKHLKSLGVATWMWGDMLLSPAEFPEMHADVLNGKTAGYGSVLRKKIPRDVVICDWHYWDRQKNFPTLSAFKKDGFHVIGATFNQVDTLQNFSQYGLLHGADGMIATTWFFMGQKNWNTVGKIIKDSGQEFMKDFPDH
jgi:hypothetical protein